MYPYLLNNFIIPVHDRLKGFNFYESYLLLKKSQHWSREEIAEYQLTKVRLLLTHLKDIPYFNDLRINYKKLSLEKNVSKIIKEFPIINKQTILDNGVEKHINKYNLDKLSTFGPTSGSSGKYLDVYRSKSATSMGWASFARQCDWIGYRLGSPMFLLWGNPIALNNSKKIIKRIENIIFRRKLASEFTFNENNIIKWYNDFEKGKYHLIRGYSETVFELAKFLDRNNYKNLLIPVSLTAESIDSSKRKVIENIFGSQIFDAYGCGECLGIAAECNEHQGLHISEEHVIFELLDNNNNEIQDDKLGEITITDLDNEIMPFIRYRTGDMTNYIYDKCGCGMKHKMINHVLGRVSDFVISKDGRKVSFHYFDLILMQTRLGIKYEIIDFQIIQESIDNIDWLIVASAYPDTRDINKIKQLLDKYLPGTEVRIKKVDSILISKKTGKKPLVICRLDNSEYLS
tara:strand:- start:137 stop:1513 length:1377 start_codon:yes stop_codon:yes gene_type:complete